MNATNETMSQVDAGPARPLQVRPTPLPPVATSAQIPRWQDECKRLDDKQEALKTQQDEIDALRLALEMREAEIDAQAAVREDWRELERLSMRFLRRLLVGFELRTDATEDGGQHVAFVRGFCAGDAQAAEVLEGLQLSLSGAGLDPLTAAPKLEDDIVRAAILWWASHRPAGWSLERHQADPTMFISNPVHDRLATAVSALLLTAAWRDAAVY